MKITTHIMALVLFISFVLPMIYCPARSMVLPVVPVPPVHADKKVIPPLPTCPINKYCMITMHGLCYNFDSAKSKFTCQTREQCTLNGKHIVPVCRKQP